MPIHVNKVPHTAFITGTRWKAITVLSPPISEDINLEQELHIVAGVTASFPIQLLAAVEWNVSRTVGRCDERHEFQPHVCVYTSRIHLREMMNYGQAANANDVPDR